MNCTKVQALLSAYLDREVSGTEMLAIRDHLRGCSCCRAEEEGLRSVKSLLCGTPAVEPDAGFEERLCASVRASMPHRERSATRPRQGLGGQVIHLFGIHTSGRFSVSRPTYAFATVGLTVAAVLFGVFFMVPNGHSGGAHVMAGHLGTMALGQTSLGGSMVSNTGVKSSTSTQTTNQGAASKRFLDALDRDHAYISSADPLSGPQVAMAASYISR